MKHALLMFSFFVYSAGAMACPDSLRALRTEHLPAELGDLCATHDRYHAALNKMETRGLTPGARAIDLHATRFVSLAKWVRVREQLNFNPWLLYDPKPLVWEQWEIGAGIVDQMADANLLAGRVAPLSLEWLAYLQGQALSGIDGLAGHYRTAGEVGMSLMSTSAVSAEQSAALVAMEYASTSRPGESLLKWHPTKCLDHQPPEWQENYRNWWAANRYFNRDFYPDISPTEFFVNERGEKRQCGYIWYADLDEVPTQLEQWLADLNGTMSTWGSPAPKGDVLRTAARAQRWFIAIHPFRDGNGRTSRFVMELVLRSLGLPSPAITDFNDDVYTPERAWASQIGEGMLRTIRTAEACADAAVPGPGCAVLAAPVVR